LADRGTPVFEEGADYYFIYLETLDGMINHKVRYYRETLSNAITFLQ
jgi:hypothetical protein